MAYGDLVQSATAAGTDATATLPSPATAGNTLVAVFGHRSGDTTPDVTGFTELADIRTLIDNSSWRRGLAVFGKIAAGGETSVQANWTPNTNTVIVVREFEGEADLASFGFSSDDSGTTGVTSQGTGTSSPSQPAGSLAVTAMVLRHGAGDSQTWATFGNVVADHTGDGTSQLSVGGASGVVSGTASDTVSWSGVAVEAGATAAILVLPEAGGAVDPVETLSGTLPAQVSLGGVLSPVAAAVSTVSGTLPAAVALAGMLDAVQATVEALAGTLGTTVTLAGVLVEPTSNVRTVSATLPASVALSGTLSPVVADVLELAATLPVAVTFGGRLADPDAAFQDITVTVAAPYLRPTTGAPAVRPAATVATPVLRTSVGDPALRHTVGTPTIVRS